MSALSKGLIALNLCWDSGLTPNLKWNIYNPLLKILENGQFIVSLQYLTPPAILYHYKSQIRSKMEYSCYILVGATQFSLDKVQKHLYGIVDNELFSTLQSLSHRRSNTCISILYYYFYSKCSDMQDSMVPVLLTLASCTCHATYTRMNHLHSHQITLVRIKFYSYSFVPRAAALWNSLMRRCVPDATKCWPL